MISLLTILLVRVGRRFAYWGAIGAAIGIALWLLLRQGRRAAEAELAIRRADARIRAFQTSKEIRHEVQNIERADLERWAHRWLCD